MGRSLSVLPGQSSQFNVLYIQWETLSQKNISLRAIVEDFQHPLMAPTLTCTPMCVCAHTRTHEHECTIHTCEHVCTTLSLSHTHTQSFPLSHTHTALATVQFSATGWGASWIIRIQKQQVPEGGSGGGSGEGVQRAGVGWVGNTHQTATRRVRFPALVASAWLRPLRRSLPRCG